MVYNDSFPEVHKSIEDSTKERPPSHHTAKSRLKWELMIMASVVAIAIAIGVGIGIWRHSDHGSLRSSKTSRRTDWVPSWLTFIGPQHRAQRRRKIL